jgi:peptidoglycan/LPS O-acetylase OafA/YrhL
MDALAIGAMTAVLARNSDFMGWLRNHVRALWLSAVILLIAVSLLSRNYAKYNMVTETVGYPLLAVSFSLMVLIAVLGRDRSADNVITRALAHPVLRAAGRYSYGMYVLHLPIALALEAPFQPWVNRLGTFAAPCYALIVVALTFVAGWISYTLMERRFLALKDRLAPLPGA